MKASQLDQRKLMENADKKKVLIIDDDQQAHKILTYQINRLPGLAVCGKSEDLTSSLRLIPELKPDVILIDLMGFEGNHGGIDIIKAIRATYPEIPILTVSMFDPYLYAQVSIAAGANGFLWKEELEEKLGTAIDMTLKKETYVSKDAAFIQ